MFNVEMASRSEVGKRNANEDQLASGKTASGWYAVLADGAGGHQRGGEAAERAVRCTENLLCSHAGTVTPAALTRAVVAAHAELQRHQRAGDSTSQMHTTLVVLCIDAETRHALWAHVGDSRLYRIRGGVVDIVTRDDSVVQSMVSAGLITDAQAREHPHKNQLVAALGIEGEIDAHTVVRPVELRSGDVFLLCSDGWWDSFDAADLCATLAQSVSPNDWLGRMQQRIEERALPRQDNFSAIAVWLDNPRESTLVSIDDTVPRGLRL